MLNEMEKKCFFGLVAPICFLVLISFEIACSTSKEIKDPDTVAANVSASSGERISLFDGQVSFVPPAGFTSMTKEQLKRKLPDNANPLLILSNSEQIGDITVNYNTDMDFQKEQLAKIKKFNEGSFRASGTKWITSEIFQMDGRDWYHFESEQEDLDFPDFVAPAPDNDKTPAEIQKRILVHYNEYSTIFNGGLLNFSYTSQIKVHAQFKEAFAKSSMSIQIKDLISALTHSKT